MFGLFPTAGMLFLMYGINTALTVLFLVCLWYVYVKMGLPGWKGILPFYNIWVLAKTLKKPQSWFWVILGSFLVVTAGSVFVLALVIIAMQQGAPGLIGTTAIVAAIIATAISLVMLVYSIRLVYALSRSFGHGVGFTAGLIVLPFIFLPILAFGESEFTGPQEQKPQTAVIVQTAQETAGEEMAKEEITEESTEGSE